MNSFAHMFFRFPKSRFPEQAGTLLLVLALMNMPGDPARAQQDSEDGVEACRSIEEPMRRLACYDRATGGPLNQQAKSEGLRDRPAAVAPAETGAAHARESAAPASGRDIFGLKDRARREEPPEIDVHIVSYRRDPYGKWIFTTEDGQVWKQTDDRRAFLRGEAITATLKRSAFGTYSVILPGNNSFKVERLQ